MSVSSTGYASSQTTTWFLMSILQTPEVLKIKPSQDNASEQTHWSANVY